MSHALKSAKIRPLFYLLIVGSSLILAGCERTNPNYVSDAGLRDAGPSQPGDMGRQGDLATGDMTTDGGAATYHFQVSGTVKDSLGNMMGGLEPFQIRFSIPVAFGNPIPGTVAVSGTDDSGGFNASLSVQIGQMVSGIPDAYMDIQGGEVPGKVDTSQSSSVASILMDHGGNVWVDFVLDTSITSRIRKPSPDSLKPILGSVGRVLAELHRPASSTGRSSLRLDAGKVSPDSVGSESIKTRAGSAI